MQKKANPWLITNSDSDSLSDFASFRVQERTVDSKPEIFIEIEFWNGGRLTSSISLPNLVRLKDQTDEILNGRYNAKIKEIPDKEYAISQEDFLEDLRDCFGGSR